MGIRAVPPLRGVRRFPTLEDARCDVPHSLSRPRSPSPAPPRRAGDTTTGTGAAMRSRGSRSARSSPSSRWPTPTPRRPRGRTTVRGTPTDTTGMPMPCICIRTGSIRFRTGITATPAASPATATGITRIATGITDTATDILLTAAGATPPVIAERLRGRASSPTGTGTGPAPGTFIRSTARAPTTGTERCPERPAACRPSRPGDFTDRHRFEERSDLVAHVRCAPFAESVTFATRFRKGRHAARPDSSVHHVRSQLE